MTDNQKDQQSSADEMSSPLNTEETTQVINQATSGGSPQDLETETALAVIAKKKRSWLLLSLILIIVSFAFFAVNPLYQLYTTRQVKAELKNINLKKLTKIEVNLNEEPAIDLSNDEIYIGKLAIPAVKMSLPIVKGSGEENLFRGAATNTSNQKLGYGNYSLSSHKMPYDDTLLFSPLLRVKKDDMIYLTDGEAVFHYKVYEIFVVSPEEVAILDELPNKIVTTLYTCETDAGTERHVVRGLLTQISSLSETEPTIVSAFN